MPAPQPEPDVLGPGAGREQWQCGSCGGPVFLDNDACLACGAALGLRPSTGAVEILVDGDVRCSWHSVVNCTWLVEDDLDTRCLSCRLTTKTPPRENADLVAKWSETERDKRRLVLQCRTLRLPIERVQFRMLASSIAPVTIGHVDGVVTLDVEEADDARRVAIREQLGEPYRTMLGHLRHETGHAMWPHLVREAGLVEPFRTLFGDETAAYQAAIDRHYAQGPPVDWQDGHVSPYATMHPHEDWAETFAHVLHVDAALDAARGAGIHLARMRSAWGDQLVPAPPEGGDAGATLVAEWLPLAYGLNAINRALGQDDAYPFVLSGAVVKKFTFVLSTFPPDADI